MTKGMHAAQKGSCILFPLPRIGLPPPTFADSSEPSRTAVAGSPPSPSRNPHKARQITILSVDKLKRGPYTNVTSHLSKPSGLISEPATL